MIRLEDLEQRARSAMLEFGGTLTPASLRVLACDAGVVAVVMTAVEHRGHGGPTEIDNLVMSCKAHHRQIHHTDWQVRIRDGIPEFLPPRWIDPGRTPRRSHTSWHDSARPRQRMARSARVPGSDDGEPAADRGAASISRRPMGRIP